MDLEWPGITRSRGRRIWERDLRPLSAELIAAADEVARDAVGAMRQGSPQLFLDVQSAEEVKQATAANIAQFGNLVELGHDPRGVQLPHPTVRVAMASVQRDLDLAPLLRIYSLGHERVWHWLFKRMTDQMAQMTELPEAVELLSSWLFAYVNESTRRITDIYDEERRLWLTSALAEQVEAVEAILSGEERDEARAGRRLRHSLSRTHLGICAWVDVEPADRDAQSMLRQVIRVLAQTAGVESMLILPDGPLAVRAWLSRRAPFDEDLLSDLAATVGESDVRLAIGLPGSGLSGFRRSHIDACHARRVALSARSADPTTYYGDVAVIALSTVDAEQARRFVEQELGALAADDETMDRIAETLGVFLDENGSRARAAARLHVHPNTVNYRVKQAESLLNRSLSHGTLSLRLALEMLPSTRN